MKRENEREKKQLDIKSIVANFGPYILGIGIAFAGTYLYQVAKKLDTRILVILVSILIVVIGGAFTRIIYDAENTEEEKKPVRFLLSSSLWTYLAEIMTIIVSCLIGMQLTQYMDEKEKLDNSIKLMEMASEYAEEEYWDIQALCKDYEDGNLPFDRIMAGRVINTDYYRKIIDRDELFSTLTTSEYQKICTYCNFIDYCRDCRLEVTDSDEAKGYDYLTLENAYYIKLKDVLDVCIKDLKDEITDDEVNNRLLQITQNPLTVKAYGD